MENDADKCFALRRQRPGKFQHWEREESMSRGIDVTFSHLANVVLPIMVDKRALTR